MNIYFKRKLKNKVVQKIDYIISCNSSADNNRLVWNKIELGYYDENNRLQFITLNFDSTNELQELQDKIKHCIDNFKIADI